MTPEQIKSTKELLVRNPEMYRSGVLADMDKNGTAPDLILRLQKAALIDKDLTNAIVDLVKSDAKLAPRFAAILAANPGPAAGLSAALSRSDLQNSSFDLMSFLKREHYGVPTYGWGLGAIGVAGLAYYFFKR